MSVVEVVRIACKPGHGPEFEERLRKGLSVQAESPSCLAVFFQRRHEDPDEFLMQLTWSSVEDHEAWRKTPDRERWRSYVTDLIEGQTQMLGHYELVARLKG